MDEAIEKLVRRAFPELNGAYHLPRLARVVSVSEEINEPQTCDTFRPYYAVDVELLTPELVRDKSTPIFENVPLPNPLGGTEEQGSFSFPKEGTIVEIAFAWGLPHRPFIRTVLTHFSSLTELTPNELTLQQSDAVKQKAANNGNWIRETFAAIIDKSSSRQIESSTNFENYTNEIKKISGSSDEEVEGFKRIVALSALRLLTGGTAHLGAGDSLNLSSGLDTNAFAARDSKESVGNNKNTKVKNDSTVETGNDLTEDIGNIRQSVAQLKQIIKVAEGGTVWVGSESVNVLQILSELIDVVSSIADTSAKHTHPGVSASPQATDFTEQKTAADSLQDSLSPVVE